MSKRPDDEQPIDRTAYEDLVSQCIATRDTHEATPIHGSLISSVPQHEEDIDEPKSPIALRHTLALLIIAQCGALAALWLYAAGAPSFISREEQRKNLQKAFGDQYLRIERAEELFATAERIRDPEAESFQRALDAYDATFPPIEDGTSYGFARDQFLADDKGISYQPPPTE